MRRRRTLRDDLYDVLLTRITSGQLEPGALLRESDITPMVASILPDVSTSATPK